MHAKYLSSTCFCCACSCRFFFRFIFCMCLSEKSFHKTRIRPMKIVFWYIKRAHQNDRYITFLSVNKDEAKEKTKQTNERRNEYLLRNFCDIQTAILLGSIFFFFGFYCCTTSNWFNIHYFWNFHLSFDILRSWCKPKTS